MIFSFHSYFLPAVWGAVLLASWMGWGRIACRVLRLGRVDWALLAGWGMAVTLAMAGALMLFGLANEAGMSAIAAIGAAGFLVEAIVRAASGRGRRRWGAMLRPRRILPLLPAMLLLCVFYATSVQMHLADPWDDWSAYFPMAKRIAQTGTLIDPFSVRRILTFGGQQVLDVQVLAAGSFLNMDILEQGLAKIVFAGLLWGVFRRAGVRSTGRRWLAGMLLFTFLLIPVPHVNVNSEMTGTVLFLALLATFQNGQLAMRPMRRALLVGLVAAAFATMRMNYVPAAGLAITLTYAAQFLRPRRQGRRVIAEWAGALAVFALLLVPWSVVLHQSSGTYLYPLFRGTQRPEYDYLHAHLSPGQTVHWVGRFLAIPGIPPLEGLPAKIQAPTLGVLALVLPVVLAFGRRFRRAELPFYLAALATAAATLVTYTLTDYPTLYRFIFPTLFALCAAVLGRAVLMAGRLHAAVLPLLLLALLIAADLFRPTYDSSGQYDHYSFAAMAADDWNAWFDRKGNTALIAESHGGEYARAQAAIPRGQKIFVASTYPALLDFSRNPIFSMDMVGGASPAPGMPLRDGPEALKAYLLNQGIDYLIFTDPDADTAHLSRKVWQQAIDGPEATPAFRRVAPFNLAAIEDFAALARTQETLYQGGTLRVLRLR